jgi:hypothetical protein
MWALHAFRFMMWCFDIVVQESTSSRLYGTLMSIGGGLMELSFEFLHAQSHATILSTPFSAAKLHPVSFKILYMFSLAML